MKNLTKLSHNKIAINNTFIFIGYQKKKKKRDRFTGGRGGGYAAPAYAHEFFMSFYRLIFLHRVILQNYNRTFS